MKHEIIVNENVLPVSVARKQMKNVRLKVFPSGEIKLSVPVDTPDDWIAEYLSGKAEWIGEKLELFRKTRAIEKEEHFTSGTSTRILGKQVTVLVHTAAKKRISCEDDLLHVFTTENSQPSIDKQVNNRWQKTARLYFIGVIEHL